MSDCDWPAKRPRPRVRLLSFLGFLTGYVADRVANACEIVNGAVWRFCALQLARQLDRGLSFAMLARQIIGAPIKRLLIVDIERHVSGVPASMSLVFRHRHNLVLGC